MNFQSAIRMLAGGSIPGPEQLNGAQITGITIAGMGIVFAGLILLVFVIMLFGKLFDTLNKKTAEKQAAAMAKSAPKTAAAPKPAAPAPVAAPAPAADDDEVIAVISAVVAAMSAADGKTYKVRSVRPAASGSSFGGRTAWGMDGRRHNTMPF